MANTKTVVRANAATFCEVCGGNIRIGDRMIWTEVSPTARFATHTHCWVEEDRDWYEEALLICEDRSPLLPERKHLIALRDKIESEKEGKK